MTAVRLLAALGLAASLIGAPFLWPVFEARRAARSAQDYPLAPGLRWIYAGERTRFRVVREVGAPVEADGVLWHPMKFRLPILGVSELPMRTTSRGVELWRAGSRHLMLPLPLRVGERWRIDIAGEDLADCEIVRVERIELPAGPRDAYVNRVVRTNRRSGRSVEDREWYVPGMGLVRMRVTLMGVTEEFRLTEFGEAPSTR